MKITLTLILILIIFACKYDPTYAEEGKAMDYESELAPLTDKELNFQDSLNKEGINLKIERTYIGRASIDYVTFKIIIDCTDIIVKPTNIDSLEQFRRNLVNDLYTNILSDSVIYSINRISTEIRGLSYQGVKHKDFFYLESYLKDSLEKWNGFNVIKTQRNKFKRIPW